MFNVGDTVLYKGKAKRIKGIRKSPDDTQYHLGHGLWVRCKQIKAAPNARVRVSERILKPWRSKNAARNTRAMDHVALRGLSAKAVANIMGT